MNLTKSIIRNDLPAIRAAIAAGQDIDAKGVQGYTPLMLSISWGRDDITALLFASGANLFIRADNKKTVFNLAKEYNNLFAISLFKGLMK